MPGTNVAWVDHEQIIAGEDWKTKILDALESANVFIVLMSIDYVASAFCMHEELGRILQKNYRARNVKVIGIAYRSARIEDFSLRLPDRPEALIGLSQMQCIPQANVCENGGNRLGLRPLDAWPVHQRDAAWMLLASQLEESLIVRDNHPINWSTAKPRATHTGADTRRTDYATNEIRAEWLPYLANRQNQCVTLTAAIKDWRDIRFRRPLLVLTEGRNEDCPAKWISRLHQHEFNRALSRIVPGFNFGHYKFVPWPTIAGHQASIKAAAQAFVPAFAAALNCPTTTDIEEIFQSDAPRVRQTFLWLSCNDEGDQLAARRALNGLLELIARHPDTNEKNILVVAVNLVHQPESSAQHKTELSGHFERLVRRAHRNGMIHSAVLGTLPELNEADISGWAQEHAADQLIDDIEMLCPDQLPPTIAKTWPMRTFARVARTWLLAK